MECDGSGVLDVVYIQMEPTEVACPGCRRCRKCERCGGDGTFLEFSVFTKMTSPKTCYRCDGSGIEPKREGGR